MINYLAKYGPSPDGDWRHLEHIPAGADLTAWQQADDLKPDGMVFLKLEGPRIGKDGQRRLIWVHGDDPSRLSAATADTICDDCES